ncbi:hypothetical protein [uncultured Peptoniphilus sp.]|uniref:hypothetical protein n=1 Tax=uncultured Peptoniphilus sp. TaxID=254354 RepID=UPI00258DA410|nr:hypothetical protein [uncultured Peptoniphilus sp.]MDU6782885.1 hypothetical protein [Peptoniphilus harei]
MKKLFGVITIASCMLFSSLPVKALINEGMDAFLIFIVLTIFMFMFSPKKLY